MTQEKNSISLDGLRNLADEYIIPGVMAILQLQEKVTHENERISKPIMDSLGRYKMEHSKLSHIGEVTAMGAPKSSRPKHLEANDVLARIENITCEKVCDLISEIRGEPRRENEKKDVSMGPISISSFLSSLADRLRGLETFINTRIEEIRKELF